MRWFETEWLFTVLRPPPPVSSHHYYHHPNGEVQCHYRTPPPTTPLYYLIAFHAAGQNGSFFGSRARSSKRGFFSSPNLSVTFEDWRTWQASFDSLRVKTEKSQTSAWRYWSLYHPVNTPRPWSEISLSATPYWLISGMYWRCMTSKEGAINLTLHIDNNYYYTLQLQS